MKLSLLAVFASFLSLVIAKSTDGDIAITINGQKYDPQGDDDIKLKNVNPGQTILVRGQHMQFDIDVPTLT